VSDPRRRRAAKTPPAQASVRRSPFLVCYWDGGTCLAHNYSTNRRTPLSVIALLLLQHATDWMPEPDLLAVLPPGGRSVGRRVIRDLLAASLLERRAPSTAHRKKADADADAGAIGFASWGGWNPTASFFHAATRDVRWAQGDALEQPERAFRARRESIEAPPPVKRYPGQPSIALPASAPAGELADTLRARRTWRQFGPGALALEELSELLRMTWGVQQWVPQEQGWPVPLKTSPSGGACHPLEAYVAVRDVKGVPKGLYHYDAASHRLTLLRRGLTRARLEQYLGGQWWFAAAPVVCFMSAVFSRKLLRYPNTPRTYRSILIEAGHFCQTFCLLATRLGLAPFCTAALADSRLDAALGLDGVSEGVIYAAGAGRRPAGRDWAPWPDHEPGRQFARPASTGGLVQLDLPPRVRSLATASKTSGTKTPSQKTTGTKTSATKTTATKARAATARRAGSRS